MNLAMHIKPITLSRGRVPMNNGACFRSEDVNGMKIERDVFTNFFPMEGKGKTSRNQD